MHPAAARIEASTYEALLKAEPNLPPRVYYFLGLCHYETGRYDLAQAALNKVVRAQTQSPYRDVARACLVAAQCRAAGRPEADAAARLADLRRSARGAPRVLAEILRTCVELRLQSDLRGHARRDLEAALSTATSRNEAQFCRTVLAWDEFARTGRWQALLHCDFTVPECEFEYQHTSRKSGTVRTFCYRFHNPALLRCLAAAYYAKAEKDISSRPSDNTQAKTALAEALLGQGRALAAAKALETVLIPPLKGPPMEAIDLFAALALRARCLAASGQQGPAQQLLVNLSARADAERDPRVQPMLLCHLAQAYMNPDTLSADAKAAAMLGQAVGVLDTSRDVRAFLEGNGYSSAKPFRCPFYMPVYRALGRCYASQGQNERALKEYEKTYDVTSIGSESVMPPEFLVRMAASLVQARKFAWALEMYTDRRMLGQYPPGAQIRHAIEVLTFARGLE